ncbi:MAG TPA: YdcF family protein [Gemmatimonadaceae bacterium]|nr:YdcF family protein [Gemmatimonadaceae bacterium]
MGRRIIAGVIWLAILGWLAVVVAVVVVGRRDEARPADAIVVLGAAQYEGRPSPVLRGRLDHVLELWRRGLAPLVIVTGGTGVGDTTSEAAVSRRYLLQHGVPDSAVVMETHGMTTIQSLHAVSKLMAPLPGRRVILVSDPFHMLRLSVLARRLGMTPYTSPTRTSPISASPAQRWRYVLAESVKVPLTFLLERLAD